jgi:hypothetical protein
MGIKTHLSPGGPLIPDCQGGPHWDFYPWDGICLGRGVDQNTREEKTDIDENLV